MFDVFLKCCLGFDEDNYDTHKPSSWQKYLAKQFAKHVYQYWGTKHCYCFPEIHSFLLSGYFDYDFFDDNGWGMGGKDFVKLAGKKENPFIKYMVLYTPEKLPNEPDFPKELLTTD